MKLRYSDKFARAIIIFLALLFLMPGCKKFVTLDPPKDRVSGKVIFADSINATAAVIGIYHNAVSGIGTFSLTNGGTTVFTGLYADELYVSNSTDPNLPQFYSNGITSQNNSLWLLWRSAYMLIYKANACIEGLTESNTLSATAKSQLIGEAKFLRAWFYFNLVNIFGDVPLILSTDFRINASLPATHETLIYDQIIEDLIAAEEMMSPVYITSQRARANKYAARALLARVYLYRKNWTGAESEATAIIENSSDYALEPELNNVFLPDSREVIWHLIPSLGSETGDGFAFIPSTSSARPRYSLTPSQLGLYESTDLRKANWTKTVTIGGTDYTYPYKYKIRRGTAGTPPSERSTVLRLAEIYLVRAEARARQDKVVEAQADLDMIRGRAGLDPTTAGDQPSLITAISNERRLELFCEFGHRWFDIKRMDSADVIMPAITQAKGGTWSPDYKVWPVPFTELQANPFLIQKPGYQ